MLHLLKFVVIEYIDTKSINERKTHRTKKSDVYTPIKNVSCSVLVINNMCIEIKTNERNVLYRNNRFAILSNISSDSVHNCVIFLLLFIDNI